MRLLTRSDFDGLICAVLLKEIGLLDSWTFVHPKDVQEGLIEVTENDILANVPYAPGVGLWFDHHASEEDRHHFNFTFKGLAKMAPSCARIIWEYYGGHDRFPKKFDEMMAYVDKCDSGRLTVEDIENPKGWVLLSFIMDPRTGLGRYRDYRISNYQLMMELVEWCRTKPVEAILEMPDVEERVERYFEQDEIFREMIRKNATVQGNLVVVDNSYECGPNGRVIAFLAADLARIQTMFPDIHAFWVWCVESFTQTDICRIHDPLYGDTPFSPASVVKFPPTRISPPACRAKAYT